MRKHGVAGKLAGCRRFGTLCRNRVRSNTQKSTSNVNWLQSWPQFLDSEWANIPLQDLASLGSLTAQWRDCNDGRWWVYRSSLASALLKQVDAMDIASNPLVRIRMALDRVILHNLSKTSASASVKTVTVMRMVFAAWKAARQRDIDSCGK